MHNDKTKKACLALLTKGDKTKDISKKYQVAINTLNVWKRNHIQPIHNLKSQITELKSKIHKLTTSKTSTDQTNELINLHKELNKLEKKHKAIHSESFDMDLINDLYKRWVSMLFDYQKIWLQAINKPATRKIMIIKSRQIGATWFFTIWAFFDAVFNQQDQLFISTSRIVSNGYRNYLIKFLAEHDISVKSNQLCIKLPNNVYMHFLATNLNGVQGKSGNVFFDEFCWIRDFKEIEARAKPCATGKQYKIFYYSSASNINNYGYKLWCGQQDQGLNHLTNGQLCSDGIFRHKIDIKQAAKTNTNIDVAQIQQDCNHDLEFANNYMCTFLQSKSSFFSIHQLKKCLTHQPLNYNIDHNPVYIGVDPARSHDNFACCVVAIPHNKNRYYQIIECPTSNIGNICKSVELVKQLITKYPVHGIAIDVTGFGGAVVDQVRQFFNNVKEVKYDNTNKCNMIASATSLINKGLLKFHDETIINDFITIEQINTDSGITYRSRRNKNDNNHADTVWAFLNVLHCLNLNKPKSRLTIIK